MKKGAIAQPIPIGQPVALTATDLERLREPRYVCSSPAKLRDSHHRIARLAAAGLRMNEIAAKTGYGYVRVRDLLASPAMDELVAQYRKKVDEAFIESQDEFFELATANMLAAERHISDHIAELDSTGDLLPVRTALAISRDAADRFGYGKKTQQTNINVDFAAALEKAIARSGKTIEGAVGTAGATPANRGNSGNVEVPRPPRPTLAPEPTHPLAPLTPPPVLSSRRPNSAPAVQVPLIRRRA